jgi:hypothetical protein
MILKVLEEIFSSATQKIRVMESSYPKIFVPPVVPIKTRWWYEVTSGCRKWYEMAGINILVGKIWLA